MTACAPIATNELDDERLNRRTGPTGDHQLRFDEAARGFVYAVGRRYVRDDQAADDVAQEAMLLAYRYRSSFRGSSQARTWLYRIAMTTALGYLRRQARNQSRVVSCDPSELAELPEPSPEASPEDRAASSELGDVLLRELDQLDDKYARVLRLRGEDYRDSEIAEQLGVTVATVKVRAYRGRAMLRRALTGARAA
jgi:RNA polymerase sigma-70 factor (ECF subfamily)